MNKSFFAMIFFFISSFFNFNTNIFLEDNIYKEVSKSICNISEYGFRVEYTVNNKILDEFKLYEPYLNKYDMNFSENENFFSAEWENNTLFINEENGLLRVQINLISKEYIDIKSLKSKFDNISQDKRNDIKYYSYIKGDIESKKSLKLIENEVIELFNKERIKDIQKINLKGGTTGIITLNDGYQFNYSIMTYEEDRKLILGIPIIFTTY